MMDPLTVQHVEAYPSVEQLQSPASMAEAMVPASVLEETTVLIERGWSHVRRSLHAKGTGVRERLRHSSAEQVPHGLRFRHWPWETKRFPAEDVVADLGHKPGGGGHGCEGRCTEKAGMTATTNHLAAGVRKAKKAILKRQENRHKRPGGKIGWQIHE